MKAEFESLQKQVEENKAEIAKMITDDKKQQLIIKSLEKDILGLKREIQEREDTLMEKEKRISDLRKKNQELEKFKFVLDFKIVELRNEIEPKEHDIIKLHSQLEVIYN